MNYDSWLDAPYQEQSEPTIECPNCGESAWDYLIGDDKDHISGCSCCMSQFDYDEMVEYQREQYEMDHEDDWRE